MTPSVYLHFALGKAREERKEWRASFDHYATGKRAATEP